jgi:hypothetical protein
LKVSVIRANQKDLIHELAFLKEELDKNDWFINYNTDL